MGFPNCDSSLMYSIVFSGNKKSSEIAPIAIKVPHFPGRKESLLSKEKASSFPLNFRGIGPSNLNPKSSM